jgi:hypothetical protein
MKTTLLLRLAAALPAVFMLAACSHPEVEGTYYLDASHELSPEAAALMHALDMEMALRFDGDQVVMEKTTAGATKDVKVDADFNGDTITLTSATAPDKGKLVLVVKDSHTLQCVECPEGMPRYWKKK